MAYTFERSYYFRPYRGNSSFWLNRYGNGSIADHQKATLYAQLVQQINALKSIRLAVDASCFLTSTMRMV